MLKKITMCSLAALTMTASTLATNAPTSAQAVIHSIGHYAGKRMHSEFWRAHYRSYAIEDRFHDDNAGTEFDDPSGNSVSR